MRWPIRTQLLSSFAVLQVVSISAIAVSSSWLAARRVESNQIRTLNSVAATIETIRFPLTANVLQQMRGLSQAHFAAIDGADRIVHSTRPLPRDLPASIAASSSRATPPQRISDLTRMDFQGQPFLAHVVATPEQRTVRALVILYPALPWQQARWQAAWPPLVIGSVTLVLMLAACIFLAHRISRRIFSVRDLFRRIERGKFGHVELSRPNDEVRDLVISANQLSDQLQSLERRIQQTERLEIVGQLAGGLSHQLRNSVAGARMAMQLHQRRCPAEQSDDESLSMALAQLEYMEQQIRGLLSVGEFPEEAPHDFGHLREIIERVTKMAQPHCDHAKVEFEVIQELDSPIEVAYCRDTTAALLNVLINAIHAAGPRGRVQMRLTTTDNWATIEIRDSGKGPDETIADRIFEPFVTAKPEGIGLGLAQARYVAERLGGTLDWSRAGEWTSFEFQIPLSTRD